MAKPNIRTYSQFTLEALSLLSANIKIARKERGWTAQEVADRAGISRGLLQRIEKGDPKCEVGMTLEVAVILGLPLFDVDRKGLNQHLHYAEKILSLLPKNVSKEKKVVDDDF